MDQKIVTKTLKPWKDCLLAGVHYSIGMKLWQGKCGERRDMFRKSLPDRSNQQKELDEFDVFFRTGYATEQLASRGYESFIAEIDQTVKRAQALDSEFGKSVSDLLVPWKGRIRRLYENDSVGEEGCWDLFLRGYE